jgi:hypothetical protein
MTPGSPRVVAAGLVGRFAYLAMPFCLVLFGLDRFGRIGAGANLAASYSLAAAVGMPAMSALAGRWGPSRLVLIAGTSSVLAGSGVLLSGSLTVCMGLTLVMAATFPPFGPLVRARWSWVLQGEDLEGLQGSARALEASLTEALAVLGPAAVASITALVGARAAWGTLVGLCGVASVGLACALRGAAMPSGPPSSPSRRWAPRFGSFTALLFGITMAAAGLAVMEVSVPAALLGRGQAPTGAGAVLSGLALGSVMGGLWYGTRVWRGSVRLRYLVTCLLVGAGLWLVIRTAQHAALPIIVAVAAVAGLPLAASTTEEFALLEGLVPTSRLTAGVALLLSVNSLGSAVGAYAGGQLLRGGEPGTAAAVAGLAFIIGGGVGAGAATRRGAGSSGRR